MKKSTIKFLLIALMLWSTSPSFAGNGYIRCSATEVLQRQLKADPGMQQRMDQIEQFTNDYISKKASHKNSGSANAKAATAVNVTIPVVFHVLYNTAAQNVSDAMIQNQLTVLNQDYSGTNSDIASLPAAFAGIKAGNTGIQFCLAQRDPGGNATTGIVRKSTTTASFTDDDKVKSSSTGGDNAWDATKYLNIWLCNLGGGLLGYAQFPGGSASTDGVVILFSSLPGGTATPYNKGRTMTHEVGHWLNLRHIWGDANCGNDLVGDTPTQQTSNFGCPTFPHVTCSNGANGDLFQNYMDYTDDACMYMLTAGQSTRMSAIFATGGARASLVTSNGCVPPTTTSCGTPSSLTTGSISSTGATLSWAAVSGAASYNIQYKTSAATTWTTVTSTTNSKVLTGLTASTTYNYQVQAVCTSTGTYSSAASFTTSATTTTCGVPANLASSAITTTGATVSWGAVSGATSYTLQYKTSGATTWTTVSGITTTSRALTGLTAATTYNFQVSATCASGTSAYSTAASFTTSSTTTITYCTSKGSTQAYEWIDYIQLKSITRSSGKETGGYLNTGLSTNLVIGSANDTIRFSAGFTSTIYTEYWKIYIDYNRNGVFTDAGETVVSGSATGSGTYYKVFSVPSTVTAGTTRMRVVMSDNSASTSCGTFTYGETEDYTVNLTTSATGKEIADVTDPGVVYSEDTKQIANEPVVSKNHFIAKDVSLNIYPNPTRGNAELKFNLLSAGNVSIRMIDMMGRTVLQNEAGFMNEGETAYTLNNLEQLTSGVYLLLLDVNGKTISNDRVSIIK
ncbi:MAG: hypothetical protein JWN78_928 [Bacteroidota bacterium]|nr:hypothetical protein [Bacteroidota bacterium]